MSFISERIKVLYLQGVSDDAPLIEHSLKNTETNIEVLAAHNEIEYIAAIKTFGPDVILCDIFSTPQPSKALEIIKKGGFDIPFISITNSQSEDLAIALMKQGADDYIFADRLNRLPYALINLVKSKSSYDTGTDEEALKRSEANLSAIIENTSDLVYSLDTDLKFITFNNVFKDTVKAIYGFDVKQGDSTLAILDSFDAEMAKKWKGNYARALKGETLQFVNEYNFNNNKVFLNYSINPIVKAGEVIGLSCFSRDITRQKLDEESLKRSEANLSAIIENSDASIYSLDTDLRYIFFNKLLQNNVKHVYGVDIRQGDKAIAVLSDDYPDDARDWANVYAQALAGKRVQFIKEFHLGEATSFFSFSVNPILENNQVIGLSCSATDITQQKTDEIALKKSEASLRTIFDNTDMSYLLIDAHARILSFNKLAQTYSEEQNNKKLVEGNYVLDYFTKEHHARITNILEKVKAGEAVNYQLNNNNKWFDITWVGIKNADDENLGFLLTNKDVTEKKTSEIESEKITADLLQRNNALEQFTYIISHNLRAPVANILGLSSLLTELTPNEVDCLELINGITTSANKLDEVITDLNHILQVSHLSENNELVSLPELIDAIKKSISYLFEKEHVTINCDFTQASSMFTIKSYLHSIFYNLILNSIKYRKPDIAPVISINLSIANEKINIAYKDNGRGIDIVKNKKDLFGLYKRFDTSVEGKGMGLFMVKMQVESLGGSITLQSKPGKGVEVELEFPLTQLREG
jgi:PAS domain S-box-containing protein